MKTKLKPLDFAIIAIAAWRSAFLLAEEEGPGGIIATLRAWLGIPACVYCVSVWTAAAMYVMWYTPLRAVVEVFAASGLALGFWSWTGLKGF